MIRGRRRFALFPYTTLFRSGAARAAPADPDGDAAGEFGARSLVALRFSFAGLSRHSGRFSGTVRVAAGERARAENDGTVAASDRKSTRLNSSHANISYAVFC